LAGDGGKGTVRGDRKQKKKCRGNSRKKIRERRQLHMERKLYPRSQENGLHFPRKRKKKLAPPLRKTTPRQTSGGEKWDTRNKGYRNEGGCHSNDI